ncbi:(R)-mandelonitrile lyase [Alteromonas sp. D210916BOD_24]|uniref:(R)-mandelonitrile lyase n=1 Tax=Alteromonas sp. D210916BOD_24 TaxID=3157618 RepID=UPI00399CD68F
MTLLKAQKRLFPFSMQAALLYCAFIIQPYANSSPDRLSDRQQAIIPIAAFTASGNVVGLERALNEGLDKGLTVNEVKEIFIHSYAYAGFPRALNGINTFIEVMNIRQQNGIRDKIGTTASPLPEHFNANAYGHKTRNALVGKDISHRTTGYAAFVPTIDLFLVEHLFADIFYRDVLTHKDRELVTISMLAGMSGTKAQLIAHMNLSLRIGYTHFQLIEYTKILCDKVNQESAERALTVLSSVAQVKIPNFLKKSAVVYRDETASFGTPDKFTGIAKITSRFSSPVSSHYRGAIVEFSPDAKTAWHIHPKGQTLIIISGKGLVQSENDEVQTMLPGDVITIPPNTRHWHGAAPDSSMSHVAISTPDDGETVTWMELVSQNQPMNNFNPRPY